MTGALEDLLAGERPAGVYRWTGADPAVAVAGAGWAYAVVSGAQPGRSGFLRGVGDALALPGWYAANFDALADCLRDLDEPTVLVWQGWAALAGEDHQAFHTALDVLAERCADPEGPAFAVLLPGPGPELGETPAVGRLD